MARTGYGVDRHKKRPMGRRRAVAARTCRQFRREAVSDENAAAGSVEEWAIQDSNL